MKAVVRRTADGYIAYPRGYRGLTAAAGDYNAALDALHDLLRAKLKAGELPAVLQPGPGKQPNRRVPI